MRCCRQLVGVIMSMVILLILAGTAKCSEYQQIAGLIDVRSTFSDGAYDIQYLMEMARKRGFEVLIINDHDRMVMEYGIPPFRNLIKKRVELNSVNKQGALSYLETIGTVREHFPKMIIIPGSETAPFYYWTGSPLKKNLTAHNHEKRILTIGMEQPEDYKNLPILHNGFSRKYIKTIVPEIALFVILIFCGLILTRWRGLYRTFGVIVILWGIISTVNGSISNSSPYDQYHGDQGISPYQLVIDYVSSKGGLTFWNYPETRSGVRKKGPIFLDTPPYPGVLLDSDRYTGFAALYGDKITITEPGSIWDKALLEYCRGLRETPPWGIATGDFHQEGESGEHLGNFSTIFLVREKSKEQVMDALRGGKMYAYRGRYPQFVRLQEFAVSSPDGEIKGISGDEIIVDGFPRITAVLSARHESINPVTVRLIRSGMTIKTFYGRLPMEIDYEDRSDRFNRKEYYRLDMQGEGRLISNPIFVNYGHKYDKKG
jgi:hypothetical protein